MRIASTAVFPSLVAAWVAGCIEYQPDLQPPPPPAQPPGADATDQGIPPDWNTCYEGWRATFSNLQVSNPYVTPRPADPLAPTDPKQLDWWDDPTREDYELSIDHGASNWWPVDEGLEGDPAYFAVYWHAWLRAWSDTTLTFQLGSSDDSWIYLNDGPIAEKPGIHPFEFERFEVYVEAGQYPIEAWFAHRASPDSAFSFRVVSGDVSICYPDFEAGETTP
jgi:hypothetical protein